MDPYQEQILEHYKEPQNFGALAHPTCSRKEQNTNCGDSFTFDFEISNVGEVINVGFTGEGCAISTASASMLSEYIKGKPLEEISSLGKDSVLELLGIELSPTRLKCALLALQAVTNLATEQLNQ